MEKKKTENRGKEIYRYKSTVVSDKDLAKREQLFRYVKSFLWMGVAILSKEEVMEVFVELNKLFWKLF